MKIINNNIAIGCNSLFSLNSGSHNISIGFQSGNLVDSEEMKRKQLLEQRIKKINKLLSNIDVT